jgi:acyl carrier protein
MQNLLTERAVLDEVVASVAEALEAEPSLVTAESSLTGDLGAESLDFLDINYRLEQTFGIRMARYSILDHAEEQFGEGVVLDENSRLTPRGVKLLSARYGEKAAHLAPGMGLDALPPLITVRAMADAVMDILATLPPECPSCSNADWRADGPRIACGACGGHPVFDNGDDLTVRWLKNESKEGDIL